ncbi:MAG: SGNH/GDSL hydrolase family protein [Candidatus Eremiobacteraeota bacterium]|nr:SGNH/GDSL hydrolase family protein [Candidatus Eremiobacteraeota bacterium]
MSESPPSQSPETGVPPAGENAERKPSGKKRFYTSAIGIFIIVLLSLIAIEVATRSLYPEQALTVPDAYTFYRIRPDLKDYRRSNPFRVQSSVSTNEDGFRAAGVHRKKNPGTYRVLCIGDSITFGNYDIGNEETYPYYLQEFLKRKHPSRDFEVINGGCPGYTCLQGMELLRRRGLAYSPDLLIIGYLHHEMVKVPVRDSDRMNIPGPVKLTRSVLYGSAFYRKLKQGVQEVEEDPEAGRKEGSVSRVSLEEYKATMEKFIKIAEDRGVKLIFLNLPTARSVVSKEDKDYREALNDLASGKKIPLFDAYTYFCSQYEKKRIPLFTVDSIHPNAYGNMVMAQGIADFIDKKGFLNEGEKK